MKKRCCYLIRAVISLCLGLCIYLFFRQGTYIHKILTISNGFWLSEINFFWDSLVRYALPDFLWGYALSMMLYALWLPKKKIYLISYVSASLGVMWEILQLLSIAKGTFDIIDCGMYILASWISYISYKKREKSK